MKSEGKYFRLLIVLIGIIILSSIAIPTCFIIYIGGPPYFSSAGVSDFNKNGAKYKTIVDKILKMNLTPESKTRFRVDNDFNPESLRKDELDQSRMNRQGTIDVQVISSNDIIIEMCVINRGHAGAESYRYYSKAKNVVDPPIYPYGGKNLLIDNHWQSIYYAD